jgi:hypothetical protein
MTRNASPAPETPARSTAEAFRAISDELRALERATNGAPATRVPVWAYAVAAFGAGVTFSLALRAAGIADRRP